MANLKYSKCILLMVLPIQELNTTYTTGLVANSFMENYIRLALSCTNKGSSDTTVRISYYDGSNDRFVAYNTSVPQGTVLIVTDKNSSFYLTEGHSIRGGAAANSVIDCVISYEDIS